MPTASTSATPPGLGLTGLAALALVAAGAAVVVPKGWRVGAISGATLVSLAAAVTPAFWMLATLLAPLSWFNHAWSVDSATSPARIVPTPDGVPDGEVALGLALVAAAAALLVWRAFGKAVLAYVGIVVAAMAALVVPVALGASLLVALVAEVVVALGFGAGALAVRRARVRGLLTGLGLLLGTHVAIWSVANEAATLISLGVLTVAWTGLAVAWTTVENRGRLGDVTAAAALLALTCEAGAATWALGDTRLGAALAMFGAAALAVGAAVLLRRVLPGYALAAAFTVPVSVAAGVVVGSIDAGRADLALLLALAGAMVLAGAAATRPTNPATRPTDPAAGPVSAAAGADGPSKAPALGTVSTLLAALGLLALGGGLVGVLPVLMEAVFGPLTWAGDAWSGAPARSGAGLGVNFGWSGDALDVVTLLIIGLGGALFLRKVRASLVALGPLLGARRAAGPARAGRAVAGGPGHGRRARPGRRRGGRYDLPTARRSSSARSWPASSAPPRSAGRSPPGRPRSRCSPSPCSPGRPWPRSAGTSRPAGSAPWSAGWRR